MKVSEQTRNQILRMLERIAGALETKDAEGMMALVDAECRGFGTGADETVIGKDAFRRQFERDTREGSEITVAYSDIRISAEGTIAWVMCGMTVGATVGGERLQIVGRYTAVFRGTGHAWLLAQSHFSVPAADQAEGRSYPGV